MSSRAHHTERAPLLPKPKDSPPECHEISHSTRICILAALWTGTFLCNLNLTMVATLLPAITSEFKESNQASWIGTAYALTSSTFTPLYGQICTFLGRRVACQIALVATVLGTLLCGISRDMIELTAARLIAGMGAGALQLIAMIVSADMYNVRDRNLPQAFNGLSLSVGLGLGGPIGGFLNDLFGWRFAFLSQVPLFILVMIVITCTMRYVTPGQSEDLKEVLSRIDFAGLISLFFMLASTLTWLSSKYNKDLPWTDPLVVIPLTLSLLSLALLLVIECRLARDPLLPPSLLKQKIPLLVCLSTYFLGACNFSIMFFLPLWFQTVSLHSASIAGLHLLPHSFAMGLGSLVAGWWLHRTGKYATLNLISGVLPLTGLIPIIFLHKDSGFIPKWFSVIPIGFGNAVVFLTMLIALQAHVDESLMAAGTAVAQLCRTLGQMSSIAIASAVFQSRLDAELRQRIHVPDADKIISDIRHTFKLVGSLPPALQRAAQDAYAASLRTVFILATCLMLVSFFLRLPITEAAAMEEEGERDGRDE